MSDHEDIFAAYRAWRGAPLALATVISTWGSAPRPRGSHMIVHADGRFEGSVSGGCVENDVLAIADEVMSSGQYARRRYGVNDTTAWEAGLPCGGEIEILIQPISENGFSPHLFDVIQSETAAGRRLSIETDLESGRSRFESAEGTDVFINQYSPPRQLFIIGAVQIAQRLVEFAHVLGVRSTVIDPRARYLTSERFPDAELDDRWPDEAIRARNPGSSCAVITLSHDPKIDDPALIAAIETSTGYIAALGSRKSHAARLKRLADLGIDTSNLNRIEGPAGLDIGAVGPSEIALSIIAGMVRSFRKPTLSD